MNNFEFLIASSLDREKVFCEIYYKKKCFGEITQENEKLVFTLYPASIDFLQFPLDEFQEAIEYAKNHLLGGDTMDFKEND